MHTEVIMLVESQSTNLIEKKLQSTPQGNQVLSHVDYSVIEKVINATWTFWTSCVEQPSGPAGCLQAGLFFFFYKEIWGINDVVMWSSHVRHPECEKQTNERQKGRWCGALSCCAPWGLPLHEQEIPQRLQHRDSTLADEPHVPVGAGKVVLVPSSRLTSLTRHLWVAPWKLWGLPLLNTTG